MNKTQHTHFSEERINMRYLEVAKRMLHEQLITEVENEIKKEIMPTIEKKIKEFAKGAVKAWSINIRNEQKVGSVFGQEFEVLVQFTENIINKIEPAPPTVKEK